jgi:ubiquinol-cytochrome c reductase cytochrome c1 subunit
MLSRSVRGAKKLKERTSKAFGSGLGFGIATAIVGAGGVAFASDALHAPHHHWYHKGYMNCYDAAALRRGYEVYRQVCSTCHSMEYVAFRNLVGNSHTEEQAKALANSYEVKDGPNDEGEMFDRPGKLSDAFPAPYPNEEYARMINAGALPPDLSCIVKARHSGDDYVFSLLTGFREPPAGVTLRQGLHYNPYFPGGAIGMAPPLMDEGVEYEDGTVATVSQQAKDVTTFLAWCSEPEADERKKMGFQWMTSLVAMAAIAGYYKRFKWNLLKTRKISYTH